MKRAPASFLALLATALFSGCAMQAQPSAPVPPGYAAAAQSLFISSSRAAIDAMVQGIDLEQVGQAPVLVATVVNVNDLSRSAPLGRTLSEIYASQLAGKGLNVTEMKLRGNVYVKTGTGELLLSREIRDIASQHNAALVLVGTYSRAVDYTYVSLKLVRTADNRIIRGHDYALPNDRDTLSLLTSSF